MEWHDVVRRIEAGEDRHTEFKRGIGDLSAVGRAMCALANTNGGLIVLGVEDSREITGVKEDTERVQERLAAFLQTGCSAPVHARTGRHEEPAGWVHWIEIPRQRGFEPMRYGGRVWIRRERSSVEPSATELQELYNAFGYILTEERAILDAGPAHIDLEAFRSYLKRLGFDTADDPQPDPEDDLRNRLFAADGHDAGGCERVTGKSGMRPAHALRRSRLDPTRAQQRGTVRDGTPGTLQRVRVHPHRGAGDPGCRARAHRSRGVPFVPEASGIRYRRRSVARPGG